MTLRTTMEKQELPGIWLLEAFRRGGVDTDRLTRENPVEIRHMLQAPGELLPRDVNTILDACARLSGDGDFGLHMVDFVDPAMLGTYGYLLTNAPTIGRFLQIAEQFYPTFYRGSVLRLRSDGVIGSLEYRVHGGAAASGRHDNEWSLGFFADFIGKKLENGWHPLRTQFTHGEPVDTTELRRIFGDDVRFDASRTAFEFETTILDRRISFTDEGLLRILTDHAETLLRNVAQPRSLESAVRLQILEDLEKGNASLESVARQLALSRSTLKRRLAACGRTFRELKESVVVEISTRALAETDTEIGAVALKLGYSELSSFDRAFKRLTGMSPTAYRQRRTGD
ncbi:MAG: AraC family transcriptional regulator [Candidatus Krumholzibacteria bacterium]|nr:AraC family transcriptional regulator [Candidatus Krumholzibacteria bacterium]